MSTVEHTQRAYPVDHFLQLKCLMAYTITELTLHGGTVVKRSCFESHHLCLFYHQFFMQLKWLELVMQMRQIIAYFIDQYVGSKYLMQPNALVMVYADVIK